MTSNDQNQMDVSSNEMLENIIPITPDVKWNVALDFAEQQSNVTYLKWNV